MLHVLDASAKRPARLIQGLAVLHRDELRDLVEVLLEERLELEEVASALDDGRLAPLRECFARGTHGFADFGRATQRDLAERIAGCGVDQLVVVGGRRGKPLAADVVAY